MSKESIKTSINTYIKENGNRAITGQILNSVMNEMVDGLASEEELATKQDTTSLVTDLATKVNALSLSDKAAFLGQISAMPATPSGDPMHYAYEAAGAIWNGTGADIVKTGEFTGEDIIHKSGYWYYNELGDISNEQMRAIYAVGNRLLQGNASSMAYAYQPIRTNLFTNKYYQGAWLRVDLYSIAINYGGETLRLCEGGEYNIIYAGRIDRSFSRATNLKKILGVIFLPSNYTDYTEFFARCFKLEYVRLRNVANNLSLSDSSYLQESSILYMIQNEAATSAITITLHADAYARAMANADIVAALQAHPNVSLASA